MEPGGYLDERVTAFHHIGVHLPGRLDGKTLTDHDGVARKFVPVHYLLDGDPVPGGDTAEGVSPFDNMGFVACEKGMGPNPEGEKKKRSEAGK
jgi:hypothetical protein